MMKPKTAKPTFAQAVRNCIGQFALGLSLKLAQFGRRLTGTGDPVQAELALAKEKIGMFGNVARGYKAERDQAWQEAAGHEILHLFRRKGQPGFVTCSPGRYHELKKNPMYTTKRLRVLPASDVGAGASGAK